jgi:hypothetical protein
VEPPINPNVKLFGGLISELLIPTIKASQLYFKEFLINKLYNNNNNFNVLGSRNSLDVS